MATVVITCPVSDRPVSTGVLVDGNALAGTELYVPMSCTLCGQLHFWCMKDARLVEDEAPSSAQSRRALAA
jgi:hypothetical protein